MKFARALIARAIGMGHDVVLRGLKATDFERARRGVKNAPAVGHDE